MEENVNAKRAPHRGAERLKRDVPNEAEVDDDRKEEAAEHFVGRSNIASCGGMIMCFAQSRSAMQQLD